MHAQFVAELTYKLWFSEFEECAVEEREEEEEKEEEIVVVLVVVVVFAAAAMCSMHWRSARSCGVVFVAVAAALVV